MKKPEEQFARQLTTWKQWLALWKRQHRLGPTERPLGSNAYEWLLFIDEHKDSPHFLAAQVVEAIEEAEKRGAI